MTRQTLSTASDSSIHARANPNLNIFPFVLPLFFRNFLLETFCSFTLLSLSSASLEVSTKLQTPHFEFRNSKSVAVWCACEKNTRGIMSPFFGPCVVPGWHRWGTLACWCQVWSVFELFYNISWFKCRGFHFWSTFSISLDSAQLKTIHSSHHAATLCTQSQLKRKVFLCHLNFKRVKRAWKKFCTEGIFFSQNPPDPQLIRSSHDAERLCV